MEEHTSTQYKHIQRSHLEIFLLFSMGLLGATQDRKLCQFDSEKDVLWRKKRQGKICPIDTTGRVSSYLGSHQQKVIDVTDQLPAPSSPES